MNTVKQPQIVMSDIAMGRHNADLEGSRDRLFKGDTYRDLSTIIVVPTLGKIPVKVVQNWMALMMPMNQKVVRFFIENMEVGDAYNAAIESILAHPELSKWKYILTLEEDNLPPPDGLLKLYEAMKEGKKYDAIGGLYWTKGPGGQPMCYGDPNGILNFIPQIPEADGLTECNGLGMGFTLFKIDLFRKIKPPWFVTKQEMTPSGGSCYTQDLYFFEKARKAGARVACDARIRVGHLDAENDIVW